MTDKDKRGPTSNPSEIAKSIGKDLVLRPKSQKLKKAYKDLDEQEKLKALSKLFKNAKGNTIGGFLLSAPTKEMAAIII